MVIFLFCDRFYVTRTRSSFAYFALALSSALQWMSFDTIDLKLPAAIRRYYRICSTFDIFFRCTATCHCNNFINFLNRVQLEIDKH